MPKTSLGIQLSAAEAYAVHVKAGWKGATVDRVVRLDLAGLDPESRGFELREAGLPQADTVIAALPTHEAFCRLVELPFSERAKVEQAAPLEAEESLPLPLEEVACHLHILERGNRRSRALVVAAPKRQVERLLAEFHTAGLEPALLDVEALALATVAKRCLTADARAVVVDLAAERIQGVLIGESGPLGFLSFSAHAAGEPLFAELRRGLESWRGNREQLPLYLSGPDSLQADLEQWREALACPVELLPFPAEGLTVRSDGGLPWPAWVVPLGLALRDVFPRAASQINLLQGSFAPQRETAPWKRQAVQAGIYAAALATLWGVGVWARSAHLESRYQSLRADVRQVFQQALPDVTNIVSEIDQMRARVEDLETRAVSLGSLVDRDVSPLRILREISARMPANLEVEFRDITVEEGRVRLEGKTTSFDATERVRELLAQYPRFVSVSPPDAKTAPEPGKVVFRLTINLGREG